jgi:osmotically-inducible protein OsmY
MFAGQAFASAQDDSIESVIKGSFAFAYLKNDDIRVQSQDGIVTLTGTVASDTNKTLAGETVANIANVKGVNNRLEVKTAPLAESSDAWLMTKVKTTLLFHRSVSATTNIDVKNGVVTLHGDADNLAQKDLTGEYAGDIVGFKAVKNEMVVAKPFSAAPSQGDRPSGETVDDASITALVKVTLLSHRSTSALKTSVSTKDGAVTLSGQANSAAEKSLVGKLASDVKGVDSVNNMMTVK